jgi:flagellar protein FliS
MTDPRFIYLETQINTASPQKLRLMLIEGGIRYAQLALDHWEQGRSEDGLAAVQRCRSIIEELIGGIRADGSALTRQVLDIYTFLYNTLNDVEWQRDVARLADVISVLLEERETWQQVCLAVTGTPQAAPESFQSNEILAPQRVDAQQSAGYFSPYGSSASAPSSSSFSLDM